MVSRHVLRGLAGSLFYLGILLHTYSSCVTAEHQDLYSRALNSWSNESPFTMLTMLVLSDIILHECHYDDTVLFESKLTSCHSPLVGNLFLPTQWWPATRNRHCDKVTPKFKQPLTKTNLHNIVEVCASSPTESSLLIEAKVLGS